MARDESSAAFTPGMPWNRGRDQVLRLIAEGRVASVTPDGAHVIVGDLIGAQLGTDLGSEFQYMRHLRNDTEYPRPDKEVATSAEAREAIL